MVLSVSREKQKGETNTNVHATHDSGSHGYDPFPASDVVKTVDLGELSVPKEWQPVRRSYKESITHPRLNLVDGEPGKGCGRPQIGKEQLPCQWGWRFQKCFVDTPQVQPPVLRGFVRSDSCGAQSAGTDRGDKETEEDGEYKDKFVAKSKRLLSVSAPLQAGRDTKGDEEDSVEESLKNETDQRCRRYGYHPQQRRGSARRTGIRLCQWVGYIAAVPWEALKGGSPHHPSLSIVMAKVGRVQTSALWRFWIRCQCPVAPAFPRFPNWCQVVRVGTDLVSRTTPSLFVQMRFARGKEVPTGVRPKTVARCRNQIDPAMAS